MRLARKAPLSSLNVFRRLIFTSPSQLKFRRLPRQLRTKPVHDALIIPPVPEMGSLSTKLKMLQDMKKPPVVPAGATSEAEKNDADRAMEIVTGWGEDKLAPPPTQIPDHEKPSHDLRVDLGTIRQFELEAYYRHGRHPPYFDRRIHLWITGDSNQPALERIEPLEPQPPIARLSHSLDRVLFNTGPHWLKDPRTRVYNFDQWLESIPDIHEFDYDRLRPYVPSSRDDNLFNLAKREGKKFAGSTSSLVSLLSHIYFMISGGREVDISILSSAFAKEPREFSYGARWPGGITLHQKDNIYRVDSHEVEDPEKHLLLNMGAMLEKFLTHSQSDFNLLLRISPLTEAVTKLQRPESYQYSKSDKLVMRAQLDAQDARLPGGGVFDIKTRATVAIRYDPLNYEKNIGYLIKTTQGAFESFEREHYDLIRAAFLKYVLQVRIGGMDGIFVAYHNTARIFGFQYFSRQDMDDRLFGGSVQGDRVFQKCVKCMEEILSEVTLCFPGLSVDCVFETSPQENALRIYVEPVEWDKPGEPPVVELLVTATNYMNGNRVMGPMNFGIHSDDWSILLNITRSSQTSEGLGSSIRKQKNALFNRKNDFLFWIPQGLTPAQMAERWLKTDYTSARREDIEKDKSSANNEEELASLALKFKERSKPSEFVSTLRELANEGEKYLAELAASLADNRNPKENSVAPLDGRSTGVLGGNVDSLPPHVEGFSHGISTTCLDNTASNDIPCSSDVRRTNHTGSLHELEHSESEAAQIEPSDIGMPAERNSMQAKPVEEAQRADEGRNDEIQASSEVGLGTPVENDSSAGPKVEGIEGDIDENEGPGVLGSEEDQVEELDSANEDDSCTSDPVSEESSGTQVELDTEDQAWGAHPIPPNTDSQPTKES